MNNNVQKYIYSKPLGKFINIEEYTEIFKKAMSTVTTINHDISHMFAGMDSLHITKEDN